MLNYYTILRVTENATSDEIKSAYRALAKEYHPDVNPGNTIGEEYFKKVNEAYAVLNDPIKRHWYNLLLKSNTVFQNTDSRKYGTRHKYSADKKPGNEQIKEANSVTPFWLKQTVLLLTMAWTLLIIYNNWFTTYEGTEMAKMVLAFLLFVVASYFCINNLYNKWQSVTTSFNPETRSLHYFLILFFLTIPAFYLIGEVRKEVHLTFYPRITEALIIESRQKQEDYWVSLIYFDEKNLAYKKDFNFKSKVNLKKNGYEILIKYSIMEPRIMQFRINLTGKDTVFQKEIDKLNENDNYFSNQNN